MSQILKWSLLLPIKVGNNEHMENTQTPTNPNWMNQKKANIIISTNADTTYKGVGIGNYKTQGNKTNGRVLLILDEETNTELDLVCQSLAKVKVIIDLAIQHGYQIVNNRLVLNYDMYCNIAAIPNDRDGFKNGIDAYTLNMADSFANYAAWKAGN